MSNPTAEEVQEALRVIADENPRDAPRVYEDAAIVLAGAVEWSRAQQPRFWTAETIADAPEGWYTLGSKTDWVQHNRYSKRDVFVSFKHEPDIWCRAFGPIPQPPKQGVEW